MDGDVVVLHGSDVAVAGDSDAVFCAFELGLQVDEALVGPQSGVVF